MPSCTILVGPPGAGKSTWVSNGVDDFEVISTDAVIEKIAYDYETTYSEIFSDAIKLAEKIMTLNMHKFADEGCDVVVDRTNMTAKGRKRFIDFFASKGYEVNAVVFPIPENWDERLASRPGKIIPKEVINSMIKNFEFPKENEGFANIWTIDDF